MNNQPELDRWVMAMTGVALVLFVVVWAARYYGW